MVLYYPNDRAGMDWEVALVFGYPATLLDSTIVMRMILDRSLAHEDLSVLRLPVSLDTKISSI